MYSVPMNWNADVGAEQRHGGEVRAHERARAQDAQPHQRVARAPLDDDEQRPSSDRRGDEATDGAQPSAQPAVGACDDGVDEQQHAPR